MIEKDILKEFFDAIGFEHVIQDTERLKVAETTNYPTRQRIPIILRPGNIEELQACVRIAHRHCLQIYPSSRGCNWGYGSRVPVRDGNILIELGRLNKILDFDERLAYVRVEPGVTFQQLFHFLREQKSELLLSVTGGSSESSVLANAIERGIGTGLYADRFAQICGLEVMLADGRRLATGFKRWGNQPAAHTYRWGSGPSLDGLFSQSNFGIVTEMTQWLMKIPEHFQLFSYQIQQPDKLPPLIDRLRELAMQGLLRPAMTLYNDFRVLSSMTRYPFELCTPGETPLDEVLAAMKAAHPLGAFVGKWHGEISLRSLNAEHGKAQLAVLEKALSPWVDHGYAVEIEKDEILQKLDEHARGIDTTSPEDRMRHYLLKKYLGISDPTALQQAYWKKRRVVPMPWDPDRDLCGMIWVCPVVPLVGEDVQKAVDIIQQTIARHPFEPAISLQCLSERAVNLIASISWDREVDGEDAQAVQCYAELQQALREAGYFSYRSTTLEMQSPESPDDVYGQLVSEIKHALDPKGILAPGRNKII